MSRSLPITRPILESVPLRKLKTIASMRSISVDGKTRQELVELILTAENERLTVGHPEAANQDLRAPVQGTGTGS